MELILLQVVHYYDELREQRLKSDKTIYCKELFVWLDISQIVTIHLGNNSYVLEAFLALFHFQIVPH